MSTVLDMDVEDADNKKVIATKKREMNSEYNAYKIGYFVEQSTCYIYAFSIFWWTLPVGFTVIIGARICELLGFDGPVTRNPMIFFFFVALWLAGGAIMLLRYFYVEWYIMYREVRKYGKLVKRNRAQFEMERANKIICGHSKPWSVIFTFMDNVDAASIREAMPRYQEYL